MPLFSNEADGYKAVRLFCFLFGSDGINGIDESNGSNGNDGSLVGTRDVFLFWSKGD